ncbi:helicase-related protein [Streptomyces hayashii]|uniref:helicase-related protein n=1 Tax=Streptomyces hayashii TaxID=2839966 RepID=UPI00403CA148
MQGEFVRGQVNALSCSTTFELGVDVGELQAVVLRNMPPSTANYVQRAGRAGRRADSAALVLTYAQRRPHDLSRFAEPERMIAGEVRAPIVPVDNVRIDRRPRPLHRARRLLPCHEGRAGPVLAQGGRVLPSRRHHR